MAYEIVQLIEGTPATIYADSIEEATERLGLTITGTEHRKTLRPCLQGQPKFAGFVGPCYGGEVNGVPVIRYEDSAVSLAMGQ